MKKLIIAFIAFIIGYAPVFGQKKFLTLNEALQDAEANYPSLKSKTFDRKAAEYDMKVAKDQYIPDVTVQHEYNWGSSNSVTGSVFPLENAFPSVSGGITGKNNFAPTFGSFTVLDFDWKVFDFGRRNATIKSMQKKVDWKQAQYDNELFQLKVRVADVYLKVLIDQKLVKVGEVNLQRARDFRKVILAKTMSGIRAGVDSAFANAEVSKAKLLLWQSTENVNSQKIALSALTGNTLDNSGVDTLNVFTSTPQIIATSENISDNPLMKVYDDQIAYLSADKLATKRSFYPNVHLNAALWGRGSGISANDNNFSSVNGLGYQVGNYLLGAGLTWNLSSYYRIKDAVAAKEMAMSSVSSQMDEEKLKLQEQDRDADMKIQLALQEAAEAPIQTKAAQQGYLQMKARYEAGLATLPELSEAYTILNRAETDESVARGNAWRALLLKAAAEGDLSILLQQI